MSRRRVACHLPAYLGSASPVTLLPGPTVSFSSLNLRRSLLSAMLAFLRGGAQRRRTRAGVIRVVSGRSSQRARESHVLVVFV
jgi:hypothetical protein